MSPSLFEVIGLIVVIFMAALGSSLFIYCTTLGARIAWRRLVEDEQKGAFAIVQNRAANE